MNDTSSPDYLSLPTDLREYGNFVAWKKEDRGGKLTKVPYNPATHVHASTTDSLTWTRFDEALSAYQSGAYDGVGFVFSSGDPYTFLDLDDAIDVEERLLLQQAGDRDPYAGLKPWANFVRQIAPHAYIALSQSGRGLHVIMRGKLPGRGGRKPVIRDGEQVGLLEMYTTERFVALTGVTL